jgi:6,7-dimethyl-8-ribityllumazine synthase
MVLLMHLRNMSRHAVARPRPGSNAFRLAIVASQFNRRYVDGLVDHATGELRALAPAASVSVHRVPGAFEIPIVVRELAFQRKANVIIAIGVILKGKTSHAKNLAHSVTNALQRIALEHGIPVVHAVLSLDNEAQARQRCLGEKINRGTEAARTAVQMAGVMAGLHRRS